MSLTIFLFKVSNLDDPNSTIDITEEKDDQTLDTPTVTFIPDENLKLLCAKVTFRGIHLWSNNVRILNNTATFIARGNRPKKFNFNLASTLIPDDKLRIDFFESNFKKKRKKIIGFFEIVLESLIDSKYIDLPEENLFDLNNSLMEATVQLKLYYTPPDIEEKMAMLGYGQSVLVDWKSVFDDEGRHGGHRYPHVHSKHDTRFKKMRAKFIGRADDADTDSYSDSDFDNNKIIDENAADVDENMKKKMDNINRELLEKSLGRYVGDPYEVNDWQVMVHIIQARDLPGLNINPYVVVQIDNQKEKTSIQKSSNSPYFGEFFTFDFKLPATHFMEKVVFIKVHDDVRIISKFKDTKPIGIFRLDLATVYNEKNHAFERKWAQLINPENLGAACGHLLVSISVTQQGVPSKNLVSETGQEDDEFQPSKTLIPAAMPRTLFPVQLKITLFGACELPEMMTEFLANVSKKILLSDTWEPVDSYVEISFNTMKARTDDRNGTTPVWGEALFVIGRFPPLIRTMKVSLKDRAAVQQDRTIASFFIDLLIISESNPANGFLPTLGPTWMFLYGSAREYTISKEKDGLSDGMGESISYKGRLLMAIECHPVNEENTTNMNVQKETGIQFPEAHIFPMKRTFLLFGCIYDVSMIDKSLGSSTIRFELSIGASGYLNPNELTVAAGKPFSSLTQQYPRVPIDNNKNHFRLPIDLQKPILFTKYTFHDYTYRMALSNRLKRISEYLYERIRDLETKVNSKVSDDVLMEEYREIENYVHTVPCGCGVQKKGQTYGAMPLVHPNLSELLNTSSPSMKMNNLDIKRRKKILHYLETIKAWVSKAANFEESKRYETIKELNNIARAFQKMALDAQPSLPDIFLWMICDTKRVAYARFQPEDLLFSICEGEKGLHSGCVQTIFLKTPRTSDQPLSSSTNAKVQLFLWLGIEEYEPDIFRKLPAGFEMPSLPLQPELKNIRYRSQMHFELRCHCYKARALIAADETGLSDPFLSITVGNETQRTPILKQSLCPQWNITLVFPNLIHVGTMETAEQIVGNVVVECYDYDDDSNDHEMIGRFSTTAQLHLLDEERVNNQSLFKWYTFKLGDKPTGELLAVFELIQVDPETRRFQATCELEEIPVSTANYPPTDFVTKLMKNKIYQIPFTLIPNLKTYEIEILFWGLRECRTINLQPIQQAEITIECAGAHITKEIKNVQKFPNFEVSVSETDRYKLIVNLPDDDNFWPHLSIRCVQKLLFGRKEIVGNLVVTNLQKYIEAPVNSLTKTDQNLAEAINELSKRIPYNFNRVRRSVIDAYEATLAAKNEDLAKKKLEEFERLAGRAKADNESQLAIINDDSLEEGKGNEKSGEESKDNDDKSKESDKAMNSSNVAPYGTETLTTIERKKRNDMEKEAGWWHKYYASKARLKLMQQPSTDVDEELLDSREAYADMFASEGVMVVKKRTNIWNKLKKAFQKTKNTSKTLEHLVAQEAEKLGVGKQLSSVMDQSFDAIELDRLKELTLLQTFDIIEAEVENVYAYEGFTDCIDTYPLYKGKGSSRSDENSDEQRIYAKFKGKFRIREIQSQVSLQNCSIDGVRNLPRMSISPILLNPQLSVQGQTTLDSNLDARNEIYRFDYNKNPVILKCRLYIIKALFYRGWDQSGKADPFVKVLVNNTTVVNDVEGRLLNTLEPVFGKAYEFDVELPLQNLICIQMWDWDIASSNDLIAETKIDVENRWFSCHRATCGLPRRYDSAGYNVWRDTKKPTKILEELCRTADLNLPVYAENNQSLIIGEERFECDPECIEFIVHRNSVGDTLHRKAHHESPDDYLRENTALAALQEWGKKINPKQVLVTEHIECRSLFNPKYPKIEQGKLEMWLDFFPMSRPPSSGLTDIAPPKPTRYQLRVTVWNTSDVELNDENLLTGEKTSDIYVKAWILGEKIDAQQTDIHYRSLSGEGNFNWRFVFDFQFLDIEQKVLFEDKDSIFQVGSTMKKIPPRIIIRVYDADFFSSDDFLGECILNLSSFKFGAKISKRCKANILLNPKQKGVNLFIQKRIAGWWPMIAPQRQDEIRDKDFLGGKLQAEFSLLTADEAEQNPAGKAREAPQPLDEPNRPKTSFLWFTSPWKTFRYIIWRNFKWTLLLAVVIFILLLCIVLAIWTVPTEITKQLTAKVLNG